MPGLLRRLAVTIGALLLYRLGCQIPLPGLDQEILSRLQGPHRASIEHVSVFALGVMPIFSILILFEIAKLAFPALGRQEAADEATAERLHRGMRLAALALAAFQGLGVAHALERTAGLVEQPDGMFEIGIVATLVAATALLGWLGDRITLRGLGDGFWLLLVAPYLARWPAAAAMSVELLRQGAVASRDIAAGVGCLVAAVALVVLLAGARAAPDLRSRFSPAEGIPESRANGAGFIDVWPPLLAKYVGGFLIAWPVLILGKSMDVSVFAIGRPIHLLVTAALVAGFAYLRAGAAPGDANGRPTRIAALAQIVICCGGEWLPRELALPFPLDGAWLIVIAAAAMNCVRRFTDLASSYAPRRRI